MDSGRLSEREEHVRRTEALAKAIGQHPDYRVLRRVQPMERSVDGGVRPEMLAGVALDVETTGLDPLKHEIIELAMQRFWADPWGRIVATGKRVSWLEEPVGEITEEITKVTGLSHETVIGRSIMEAEATCMIRDAHFVISHNAGFDRPFVERRLPMTQEARWVCSMKDVDWRENGFEGRVLGHLLNQIGWFHDAHRAQADVDALLHLLDDPFDGKGTVLRAAVDKASLPSWRVSAVDAPFSAREALKARGYRWNADGKVWTIEVDDGGLDAEIGWAVGSIYAGRGRPRFDRITWNERYA